MAKYLDETGLAHFWDNIKDKTENTYISPKTFSGSNDYEKLQAAITYAEQNKASVFIDDVYDITGHTLTFAKGIGAVSTGRQKLSFIGVGNGQIYKGDSGHMFTASPRSGDISFTNVYFKGNASVSDRSQRCSVFDCSKLIRLETINCTFSSINIAFDGTSSIDGNSNIQSNNHYGDLIHDSYAYYVFGSAWDVAINSLLCETCNNAIVGLGGQSAYGARHLVVSGSCIEDITENGIKLGGSNSSVRIEKCYFETIKNAVLITGYNYMLSIRENRFAGALTGDSTIGYGIDLSAASGTSFDIDQNYYASQSSYSNSALLNYGNSSLPNVYGDNIGTALNTYGRYRELTPTLTKVPTERDGSNYTDIHNFVAGFYIISASQMANMANKPSITATHDSTLLVLDRNSGKVETLTMYDSSAGKVRMFMYSYIGGVGWANALEIGV